MVTDSLERSETLTLRLSGAEKRRLQEVSRRVDRKPSAFVRWLLVKELGEADIEEQHQLSRDAAH